MNKQVKLFIDNRNLERVKFYFLNSLNIDPTFENYREDYEYAKKNNVFEIHKDMMPFNNNKNSWNEEYFNSLQDDLNINFSERRLEHMIEVAKVVFREKIDKLEKERQGANKQSTINENNNVFNSGRDVKVNNSYVSNEQIEQHKKELEEKNKKREEENKNVRIEAVKNNSSNFQKAPQGEFPVWILILGGAIIIAGIILALNK